MIRSFLNQGTEDIFNGRNTRQASKVCPTSITRIAARKLDQINAAVNLDDLRAPPSNHLEALLGDRLGQHSIRINARYRICFVWTDIGAAQVEIVDYH